MKVIAVGALLNVVATGSAAGVVGGTKKSHKVIREEFIKCSHEANYDAGKALVCATIAATDLADKCTDTTKACSSDMPTGVGSTVTLTDQVALAKGEVGDWYLSKVCDVDGALDGTITTWGPDSVKITKGGSCLKTAAGFRPRPGATKPTGATAAEKMACAKCRRGVRAAQLRVAGVKQCGAQASANDNIDIPKKICSAADVAQNHRDDKAAADANAETEIAKGAKACVTANTDMKLIKKCQYDEARRALADGNRGGNTCTGDAGCNAVVGACQGGSVCVCPEDKTGGDCSKNVKEVVDQSEVANLIKKTLAKKYGESVKNCLDQAKVIATAADAKIKPTQSMLLACEAAAKADYLATLGGTEIDADPIRAKEKWNQVKRDAAEHAGNEAIGACTQAAILKSTPTEKSNALKICRMNKERIAADIKGEVFQFPCSTTCAAANSCFDAATANKDKLVRACSATEVDADLTQKITPEQVARVEDARKATGQAIKDCMKPIQEAYISKTACDAEPVLCVAARKACVADVAKTALANAKGELETDISATELGVAVSEGTKQNVMDAVRTCIAGIKDQLVEDPSFFSAAGSKKAAQLKCADDNAKQALMDSQGFVDPTDIPKGKLAEVKRKAQGLSVISAVETCTKTAANLNAKRACRLGAGKRALVEAKGGDSADATDLAAISKADVNEAMHHAAKPKLYTTVSKCVEASTTKKQKKNCVFEAAKATYASVSGETIDTTAVVAAVKQGKVKLENLAQKAALDGVRSTTKACMDDAKTKTGTAKTAAVKVCRDAIKTFYADGCGKPAADVKPAEEEEAKEESSAGAVKDANKACYMEALTLADKKACFVASKTAAADARGKVYDPATKAVRSEDKLNELDFQKIRSKAKNLALVERVQACKAEGDEATSCSPAEMIKVMKEAYGVTSEGTDAIVVNTNTKIDNVKIIEAATDAAIEIVSSAVDACIAKDENDAPLAVPGDGANDANVVRDCAKAQATALGIDVLTSDTITPGKGDAAAQAKRWKRKFMAAARKKVALRWIECKKAGTADCATITKAYAERIFPKIVVDHPKFVRHVLLKHRQAVKAAATKCDASTKADCKAALKDARTTKDVTGADAPETTNAGGKSYSEEVEKAFVAKGEAAKKFAECKLNYAAADFTATVKQECHVLAKAVFGDNGGNDAQWTEKHMKRVERLGDSIAAGEETVITTTTSVDVCATMASVCGDAAKVAKIKDSVKTACGDADKCEVADTEQITLTGNKCNYCFRVKQKAECTDDTTCDAFAKKMSEKTIGDTRRRRLLESASSVSSGTTTEECPASGCENVPAGTPTMPPTIAASAAAIPYLSAAAVGALALVAMVIA
jgi:hypothetical protein